jgi:hypothetical protein
MEGLSTGTHRTRRRTAQYIKELPGIMARHGNKEFTYVADSALVTEENLFLLKDIPFVTRLPVNFAVCGTLIRSAVAAGAWQEGGQLSHRVVKGKDVCASYRLREAKVALYGRTYRAIGVHSDVHDRRRRSSNEGS